MLRFEEITILKISNIVKLVLSRLLPLNLPGFFDSVITPMLAHYKAGNSKGHFGSSQSPRNHIMSRTPSFIAMYSASMVLCALRSYFRGPYETALSLIIVTYPLTDDRICRLHSQHHCMLLAATISPSPFQS
ncbi:hypothetical protein PHMEG_0003223 [Phytophthora megakarya]|uniref:Uncharacterized protein n=1 Tax=Phytophthora megakarya TaxID=4795 RepID=A0A225WWY8_9STRA|nr:hypothetical protein PHMEG_0003223 [Phytophthora megakarya]